MLGLIFSKAQNKIQDPAKLRQLIVDLIGKENWLGDVGRREGRRLRGPAGAERPGHEERRGAVLHAARRSSTRIVDCVQPAARARSSPTRPAAPAASSSRPTTTSPSHYELDQDQKRHLRYDALRGVELVDGVARLCAMNLFLHGIGPDDDDDASRRSRPTTPCASEPSDARRRGADQPALRQEVVASPSSTRRARPTARRSPTTARTSGRRPRTSSSTSSST